MTVTTRPLITANYAANTETTEYTAGANMRTIIDKFTGTNVTGAAVTLTVKLIPNGSTAGTTNTVVVKSIQANTTEMFPELVGHVLEPGGAISVLASAASSIVRRCSGREVT